jgi:rRNA maturation RNase YbeY
VIAYYVHEIDFRLLDQRNISNWIKQIIANSPKKLKQLNYIFCSDDYLLAVNKDYLQHDYYTDIITFDLSDSQDVLEGELYLSVDRIQENAKENDVNFADELHRVMIHGVLHLLGQGDKNPAEAKIMRQKENEALQARLFHVKQYRQK